MALLVAAACPVIAFLIYIYRKDTEKEPPRLLFKCFILGCAAIVPAASIELLLSGLNNFESALSRSIFEAFVVAALVEEGFKFLFLNGITRRQKEFDQYFDGIVYAVFISLGFALVENILYVFEGGLGVAVMRAVLSVPAHGLFGVMMGYFFALAKFSPTNKKGWLFVSFLLPVLFHGLYDFFLMYLGENESALIMLSLFAGFVIIMVLLWRNGARYIKKLYAKDKGTIPSNTFR